MRHYIANSTSECTIALLIGRVWVKTKDSFSAGQPPSFAREPWQERIVPIANLRSQAGEIAWWGCMGQRISTDQVQTAVLVHTSNIGPFHNWSLCRSSLRVKPKICRYRDNMLIQYSSVSAPCVNFFAAFHAQGNDNSHVFWFSLAVQASPCLCSLIEPISIWLSGEHPQDAFTAMQGSACGEVYETADCDHLLGFWLVLGKC